MPDDNDTGGTRLRRRAGETDEQLAARQAEADAAAVSASASQEVERQLEEARAQSLETLKAQEEARPYPSQEQADQMRASTATTGGNAYNTREAKA